MQYVSTRAGAPELGFEDVIITGLANDGGLYVPKQWPTLSRTAWRDLAGKPYQDVALAVMWPFVEGSMQREVFKAMIDDAYASFSHRAVTPLTQLDHNHWLLELYHGPTLAFKDVAMQLLARLMDWALERADKSATIVAATSGDTGGAAIEAFKHSTRAKVFVLHPHEKVSAVQRRQMTTTGSDKVANIALEGNFDDCQNLVKAMFAHKSFRSEQNLAGVNSINWARIMAQTVYYATSALALGAPDREVSFTVPTGNFGDIFAGYVIKQMGLPIDQLVIATNSNDILDRTLKTGRYEVTGVEATTSPSMDIQVSSNFERLLFDLSDRDGNAVERMMSGLAQSGAFEIPAMALERLRDTFQSGRTDEQTCKATITETLNRSAKLIDPHTAVAYAVARQQTGATPMVTLSTAHPAKFPDAVEAASGIHPQLPRHLTDLFERQEQFDVLANDLHAVESFIAK
jgi:threonine synthase